MTTAIVLSGGANLGSVQVGMMQAVADFGVRPDFVVGTSVGAVNGAWLVGGRPLAELSDLWCAMRRTDVFPASAVGTLLGFAGRRDHVVRNRGIRELLQKHLTFDRLEDARIPFHVIATDVLTGGDVCLSSGPAIEAVLASAAIPGVFPPVEIDGKPLMDGGVVNNTPISHAIELGATTVWVLPTGYACTLSKVPGSALGMGLLGVTLAINQRLALDIERYESAADIRVVPPLCPLDTSPADFGDADELITRAREQTAKWLDEARVVEVGQADLLLPHVHG